MARSISPTFSSPPSPPIPKELSSVNGYMEGCPYSDNWLCCDIEAFQIGICSKMKRIGIDTEALKEHFGKKIMELEEEKRKVQKSQDVHGQKLKALEAQILDLKKKQENQVQLLKQKEKSEETAKKLQAEIQYIKAQKALVQLQHKMKQEAEQLRQWKASREKELLQGGFRKVYKGVLPDGTKIAVKRGGRIYSQAQKTFQGCLSSSRTQTWGGCFGLAYEKKVALGTARGLEYLHEQCNPKFIHRDVKAANVLLDVKAANVEGEICSSSVVEVENELEEEETGTYKASCVVAEESGKLGGERSEEGRCGGLVVVESCTPGDEGGGEGTCALVAAETGTCSASCVVVESGALGKGEGRACELVVVEESGKLGGGEGRVCELVVVEMSNGKEAVVSVVVVEMGSGKVHVWVVVVRDMSIY
ncbi:hypothetical protein Ahy_B09g098859 isoform B [Arachis hypogaea]|uniref:non-specific serine/threonine protein kinase n=1 Tax=Arachis hypogaea TaxID=3818 RepID=A0A444XT44_ARAHY|nr:hypothetical protein Ahy_B09g098859 isoform B [Arachis hypogaea]